MKYLIYLLCFSAIIAGKASAQSITPFSIWKQVTQRGDITFTGNTTLTCTASGICTTGQAAVSPTGNGSGNNYNNNGFTMVYNNIADATDPVVRFSRTNANLTLGTTGGCGVIHATLFWGGNMTAATPNYSKRDSVYLKTPVGGYTGLKADLLTDAAIPFGGYYCYKDVTNLVRQGGPGTYWLANHVAQAASSTCGGWTLVVIYADPTLPLRNLTIFRGISSINATNPQNIPISGFFTPPSPAAVNLKLGVYSLEGDRGTTGDSLKFNGNPVSGFLSVSDAKNQNNNAFNSTITNNTAEITRNPSYPNTLGIDEDIFVPDNTAKNYLLNSASAATIRMTSSGDVYAPFMISTAIDVFEPLVEITKDVVDLNGGLVELGDTLKFNLKVVNKGNDPATNVILHDSLYGAMNYVPNSLKINTGALATIGTKSDAADADQAEFALVGGINFVKFRLGTGANGATGGAMGITAATDSVSTVEFKVTVTTDCQIFHCNPNLVNKAYVTFVGNISGASRSTYSSPNGVDQYGCPALGPTTLVVNVPVCTPVADTNVIGCRPYNLSNIAPNRPGYTSFFNSTWTSVTQAATAGTYFALKQLYPGCSDTIQINFTSPCTLPIIMADFNVAFKNNLVTLNWVTRQEINNKEFRIERSVDGVNFEQIATVTGAVNSSVTKTYSYDDYQFPHVSRVFYRLVQIDLDGSKQSSTIKWVYLKDFNSKSLDIYAISPQPVTNWANLSIIAPAAGNYLFTLLNSMGQLINQKQIFLQKGHNSTPYDCTGLPSGYYLFEVQEKVSGEKDIHKLIIQNKN
jgi:uncharacterized repeat protein (TIGR01451 family)